MILNNLRNKIPKKILKWLKLGKTIYLTSNEGAINLIDNNLLLKPFEFIIMFLKKNWFKGKKIVCPLCKRSFRRLLPFGNRKSVRCPFCTSLERHRLIMLYLLKKTNFFFNYLSILHISPNKGFLQLLENQSNLKYVSIDLLSPRVTQNMDISDLKFDDKTFDICICVHVLEHINDDIKAIKEIFRVLKPNGWAILQSPIDYSIEKTFEHINSNLLREDKEGIHHRRTYGRDYINRLEISGFNVRAEKFGLELGEKLAKKFRVDKNEIVYICIKPDNSS